MKDKQPPPPNREKQTEIKKVKFWDTEDKKKDQMLVCYRDERMCRVIEFIKIP